MTAGVTGATELLRPAMSCLASRESGVRRRARARSGTAFRPLIPRRLSLCRGAPAARTKAAACRRWRSERRKSRTTAGAFAGEDSASIRGRCLRRRADQGFRATDDPDRIKRRVCSGERRRVGRRCIGDKNHGLGKFIACKHTRARDGRAVDPSVGNPQPKRLDREGARYFRADKLPVRTFGHILFPSRGRNSVIVQAGPLAAKHATCAPLRLQAPESDVASFGVKTIPFQRDFRDRLQYERQ
jgi:hypothetical protein